MSLNYIRSPPLALLDDDMKAHWQASEDKQWDGGFLLPFSWAGGVGPVWLPPLFKVGGWKLWFCEKLISSRIVFTCLWGHESVTSPGGRIRTE